MNTYENEVVVTANQAQKEVVHAAAATASAEDDCMGEQQSQKPLIEQRLEQDSWDMPQMSQETEACLTENVQASNDVEMVEKTTASTDKPTEQGDEEEVKTAPEPPAHHPNWIPPELRRPEDEFVDLDSIEPLNTIAIDENLTIMTTVEGKGLLPEAGDTIYYKHQTRFDNGQLVSFDERRKVTDMVVIDDKKYQAYLNACFKVMRRGQTAWIKVGEAWLEGGFHTKKFLQKPYMTCEADVGRDIWTRVEICQIKRDAKCPQKATYAMKLEYLEKVRGLCRELVAQGEYTWAADLYARAVQAFHSISKFELQGFTEEQKQQRSQSLTVLHTNLCYCFTKKKCYEKAIKAANTAIEIDPRYAKAHYRMAQTYLDQQKFQEAVSSFKQAIKLDPSNLQLREEYQAMIDFKNATIREQNSKMMGFFDKAKVKEQMTQEDKDEELRQKIARQSFGYQQ